jgi:hypothetical protein
MPSSRQGSVVEQAIGPIIRLRSGSVKRSGLAGRLPVLARLSRMGYNPHAMEMDRRRVLLLLALTAIALTAAALILRHVLPGGGTSPLTSPGSEGRSPLPQPGESPIGEDAQELDDGVSPSLWTGAAAALLWVAMGIILALVFSVLIRRFLRPTG